jgi:hypothetical protein
LPDDQLPRVLEAVAGEAGERTLVLVTGRDSLRDACDRTIRLSPSDEPSPDQILDNDASEPAIRTVRLGVALN